MYILMYITSMTKKYSIAEARSNLPSIVDDAQSGQEIELTRRGEPVAVVLSIRELEKLRRGRRSFAEAYGDFLERHVPEDIGVSPVFIRSLRNRTKGRRVRL